ncbi:MAG: hypothetical protein IKN50_04270, partial [Clostridia bacterium]|nr:hypothetical protein [Clostridia bacterium]
EAFFVFYYRKKDPSLSLRSLVTLYFGVAICVGTDNGMCQNCLVTYLLLASVVCNVYNFAREDREKLSFTKKILPLLAVIMATVMFVGTAWTFGNRSSSKKYRDFNFCTLDSYTDAPAFGRVKTTKEKAAALNTVYWFFKDADYSDKRTLVFGDFPAFYLATDCRAYKSSVWMDSASEAYLKGKLNESLEAGDLPIFVFNKCHYGYIKEIPITWTESSATARNFAADHGYVQVFDNDYIEILVPQD